MDDEDQSSSCSYSSSSDSSKNHHQNPHIIQQPIINTSQYNASFSHSQKSSTNPSLLSLQHNNMMINRPQLAPIIIEKVVPNSMPIAPKQSPKFIMQQSPNFIMQQPRQSLLSSTSTKQTNIKYAPYSDTYQVNKRGEKFTKEGNRILFMDVIQPNIKNDKIVPEPYKTPKIRSRSHRRRSKHIPVIDLQSVENFIKEHKKSKSRRISIDNNEQGFEDYRLATSDILEIVDGYFEDFQGRKMSLNGHDAQSMLDHLEATKKTRHRRKSRHRSHSILTSGPSINYVERASIQSLSQREFIEPPQQPISPEFNSEQVNEHVSNISENTIQSIESSKTQPEMEYLENNNTASMVDLDYMSPFRYMQSSINPLLLREYRNTLSGN